MAKKKEVKSEWTVEIPANAVEPETILLEKVKGKIGTYKVAPAYYCLCKCDALSVLVDPGAIRELEGKVDLLVKRIEARFGEIDKILSSLKRGK